MIFYKRSLTTKQPLRAKEEVMTRQILEKYVEKVFPAAAVEGAKVIWNCFGQGFQFFFVWNELAEEYLIAGFCRVSDGLSIFRVDEIFCLESVKKAKIFLQFRLVRFRDQVWLAIFRRIGHNEFAIRQMFPLEFLLPKSVDSRVFTPLTVSQGAVFGHPAADLMEMMRAKQEFAREVGVESQLTDAEAAVKRFLDEREKAAERTRIEEARRLKAIQIEAERQERERQRLERLAEREQRKADLEARPTLRVFQGQRAFFGKPITITEYAAQEHCVLQNGSWLVVVDDFDRDKATAVNPVKIFILRKSRGGRVEEEVVADNLSADLIKQPDKDLALEVTTCLLLLKGEPTQAMILTDELRDVMRARGAVSGLFILESQIGKPILYKFQPDGIGTVGPAEHFR